MPKRDDVFCIMYTSGSTGAPKGVILTHHNIICSLGATTTLLKDVVNQQDTFLAFLPLSHILEMLVELTFYTMGVTVGYGGTKTLTDASVRNCSGDLKAYAPSIIVGVRASCAAGSLPCAGPARYRKLSVTDRPPSLLAAAIFETIRKGIVGKINAASSVTKGVFNLAYALKKHVPALAGPADAVVFSKIKDVTGGRLRICMNVRTSAFFSHRAHA